ncbi:MAG: hypothetical protein OEZ43_01975 [Gammaproteobacteria bacterium]|nr:hypothetical protein [Gammaproteobacteria bacterium]
MISKSVIKPDQPLLYPLFRQDGSLLADKGLMLTENQHATIVADDVYTLDFELVSAVENVKTEIVTSSAELNEYKLPSPFERLRQAEGILKEVYSNPHYPTNQSKFLTTIGRVQAVCKQAPDAAIAKIFLDDKKDYTVQHAVHTAILCEIVGDYLNWGIDIRRSLCGAALSMNFSLGFLQDELQHQPEPLTDEQRQSIENHPLESARMLNKNGITDTKWLDFVAKHHEQVDGSGYPNRLSGKDVPVQVSLLRLADVYCAKVTGRSYREPIVPNIAARDIYLDKNEHEKTTLIEIFVKCIGLFPPGTLVKLVTGETGMVLKRGIRVDTPFVKIIRSAQGKALSTPLLRNTQTKGYEIVDVISFENERKDLDFEALWN